MECAQNDDAQALVHTCAQNRCAQESLLLSLLPSSALFSLPLFYISLGIFWSLLVQCWFHAGSLYPLVESGPAGSFRHMRASLLKSGWIVNSGWYGRNSMKLRPNFLTLHFTIGTSGCRSPAQKADGLTCSQLAIDCMVQTSRHSSWPGLAWSFQVRSQDCKACNE